MGLLEQLQEQGWYITQPGLDKLLEGEKNGTTTNVDVKQVVKLALNVDLREYGAGALSSLASRGAKSDTFDGPSVVQLVKLRNLGAPKVNEESKVAPRLLKLTITDGQTQYVALEHEHIPSLSLNTPPGTKILLKNGPIRIVQGVMMLSDKNVQVLGGHVTALVEKWELSRTMAKYAKGGRLQFSASGPPPWIPFGQKIQQPVANSGDKDFKSLQPKEKEESTENTAFNALRNDAIAEATKLGTKKTFGGGAKQMVDANVQKIMDKGFTEEQATHALKLTRNNVHRALSNLQRIEDRKQAQAEGGVGGGKLEGGGKSGGKRGGFGKRDEDDELLQSKPSGKVSLFDYFGDILADTEPAVSSGSGGTGAGGGKKTSKESTPVEKEQNRARSDSTGRQTGNNRHHPPSKNPPSGGTNRSHGDSGTGNHSSGTGMVNGSSSKNYNQQRFENNISSSFANRNTTTTSSSGRGGERGRGEQHGGHGQYSNQSRDQQQQQQSGYKQSDYYGSSNNSRYRGSNTNENHSTNSSNNPSTGPSGARGGNSRGGGDSKYHQQQQSSSGYNHNSQQQRQDGYNNNSSNSNATGGAKYNGKGQSNNNASGGYGNSYGSEGRNQQPSAQYGTGPHESRQTGGKSGSGAPSASTSQQQPQQQSSYGNASKQSGYHNQHQGTGSSYNNNAANGNQQYNQQASSGGSHGNNYGSGGNNGTKNSNKGGRYGGKDESHKYAGGNAPQSTTTTATSTSNSSQQSKKGPSKGHHGSQQPHSNAAQNNNPSDQHSSYGSSGKPVAPNTNANSKVNQVTDQMGNMQISDSKSSGYNATNSNNHTSHAPVPSVSSSSTANKAGSMKSTNTNNHSSSVVQQQPQHTQQVASPPGVVSLPTAMPNASAGPGAGPSPGAPVTPSPGVSVGGPPNVPKSFIQLPNGYNYNPYQIMGFQNKQTNEFALNVLKSQQQFDPMQQPPHLGTPGPVPATVSPVGPNVMPLPGPNVAPSGVLAQAPPPPAAIIATAPTPGSVPGHGTLVPPGMPMAAAPMAPQAAGMAGVYPNWKIGDRCLAKYWEDGNFYTAEITDTSKNTFVVHFLEYGNYEEVLKTDCIPITQAATPAAAPAPMALGFHPAPATPHMPPPHPAAAAPVPFAPHPGAPHPHLPHQHHHGHVPHHPMAAPPGPYQAPPMQDVTHGNQHTHYAPFKPGPMPPVPAPMPTPPGQGQLPPAMNQYQPAQHHLHQPQQQHHLSQQQQQQQQQQQGGHMPQHHHQSQMQPQHGGQQRPGGKFREQRPMYVPPAQRK
ncbi:trithorax group protein osa [Anopheles maculipalpis]|uniref:trithorax group protein osa n=1 Tax=Anopheles maculipalpis TaxID=1496333 RepID=UPI002158CB17|nr:trithorax group protein osa [Anopheles maculipalpis]